MTYCISDIHGCYDEFMALHKKINFAETDTLYVLGDAVDRGPDSIKCVQYIMNATNIHMLPGNHELMMLEALANDPKTEEGKIAWADWFYNGGHKTLKELAELPEAEANAIVEYLSKLPYTAQVKIGEQNYVLVHAGLDMGVIQKKKEINTAGIISKQDTHDMVWIREKFIRNKALPRSIIIFGHTHMFALKGTPDGKIWRDERFKDKIGIDGGCVYGGNLLALRLDDMAEFAVDGPKKHR